MDMRRHHHLPPQMEERASMRANGPNNSGEVKDELYQSMIDEANLDPDQEMS